MAIKRGSKVELNFSAASMTDLMFLLLLFMFLATTLINPNALKLLLPKSANLVNDKPYTTVSITAELQYYVDKEPVTLEMIAPALHSKMDGIEGSMVSLNCDERVTMGEAMEVMNIIRDNGFPFILATRPK